MKQEKIIISARRTFQGAWALSAIVDNNFIQRQYIDYTKKEAVALFREYIKEGRANKLIIIGTPVTLD